MNELYGFVDYFDGQTLWGWALDQTDPERTLAVEVYVDDVRVATVSADRPREDLEAVSPGHINKAFAYTFDPPLCPPGGPLLLPEIPTLTVKFAGTDRHLRVVADLLGVVNIDHIQRITGAETLVLHSDNRFLPTPNQRMVEHVAGEGATPSSYRAVGLYVLLDLIHLGLLTNRSSTVVDVGCGCGRVATHLAPFLTAEGRYIGYDTWAAGIDWGREHITSVYPNTRFERIGADPGDRKDPGYVGGSAYQLPLEDGSCDLVMAASLFTHLTWEAARDYLQEFRRVLKPTGRAWVTFFILDDEAERLLATRKLRREERAAFFQHRDFFDTYFTNAALSELFMESGMTPILRRLGHWRGDAYYARKPVGCQDLFVLKP